MRSLPSGFGHIFGKNINPGSDLSGNQHQSGQSTRYLAGGCDGGHFKLDFRRLVLRLWRFCHGVDRRQRPTTNSARVIVANPLVMTTQRAGSYITRTWDRRGASRVSMLHIIGAVAAYRRQHYTGCWTFSPRE